MFQYTKEIILHNVEDRVSVETGVTNPYSGKTTKKILIKRGGEYYADFICPDTVHITEGYEGTPGVLTIDLTDATLAPGLYQLQFRVKTPNQFFAEFANPNWQVFGKPMLIGFDVTEEMSEDVSLIANKIASSIQLALPDNNKFIKTSVAIDTDDDDNTTTKVVVTATNDHMTFDKLSFEKYDPTVCDSCLGEYAPVPVKMTVTDNVEAFATADWLVENLRFPTYPNIRYASSSEDEKPIPGTVYTEFSFAYQSPRPGLGGASGVGQEITAVTRHIFYVPKADVTKFKGLFTTAGITVDQK